MQTHVTEIADRIYRFSTFVPEVAAPAGFTFNQFLIDADQPLLFHCGHRRMFPLIADALARVMPVERLRWVGFGHIEADECGAMNDWLDAAPQAEVAHGMTASMVSLEDMADRPPKALADGTVLDLGGRRVRYIDTPHVPHGWEAGVMYEEVTGTLLCGDLFTHVGDVAPLVSADIVGPAAQAEEVFLASALTPSTAPTIRSLAALRPKTLALMHGSSFNGDCAAALEGLADFYQDRLRATLGA
ncbi:MBL fold metallo-hydrolase [Emcibacter sp. SYSU 3D8]|uniref:MBL fold metallo-hydrolase n=1 Tax=Emcibacter sp. SYSU 3D8 TaxID=3133969 RepID=UPI0031FF1264